MCDRDVCGKQAFHLASAAETCDRGADAAAAAAAVADVNAAVAAAVAAAAVDAAASAVAAAGVVDDLRDCCHLPGVDSVSRYKG